jgi:multicomponent Na+:H+ antiporter subunit B
MENLVFLDFIGIVILVLLVIVAAAIVLTRNLFTAVMLLGIFSLLIAASFFLLDAADVALTEAAVGAGISTVLMLGTLALTTDRETGKGTARPLAVTVIILTALILLYATFDKPSLGDPDAPVHGHVSEKYLHDGMDEIGVPNFVTAILASYRGIDTLGEVAVVFTAATGVALLLGRRRRKPQAAKGPQDRKTISHHLVPRVVSKLLIPFIMLFALYVQFHGDYGPGGGFQAGAIFASAVMLYAIVQGDDLAQTAFSARSMGILMSAGLLLYAGVGFASLLLGGNFLDYSVLAATPVAGQHLGILLIEAGVGMTVTAALITIFYGFSGRESR